MFARWKPCRSANFSTPERRPAPRTARRCRTARGCGPRPGRASTRPSSSRPPSPFPRRSGSTAGNIQALSRLSSRDIPTMPAATISSPSKRQTGTSRWSSVGSRSAGRHLLEGPEGVPGAAVLLLGAPADLVEAAQRRVVVDVELSDLHGSPRACSKMTRCLEPSHERRRHRHDLETEALVDRDHVRVGLGVLGVDLDHVRPRLLERTQVGDLDRRAEPVPPVVAVHVRRPLQRLVAVAGLHGEVGLRDGLPVLHGQRVEHGAAEPLVLGEPLLGHLRGGRRRLVVDLAGRRVHDQLVDESAVGRQQVVGHLVDVRLHGVARRRGRGCRRRPRRAARRRPAAGAGG